LEIVANIDLIVYLKIFNSQMSRKDLKMKCTKTKKFYGFE